jgi:hypothetical protein
MGLVISGKADGAGGLSDTRTILSDYEFTPPS